MDLARDQGPCQGTLGGDSNSHTEEPPPLRLPPYYEGRSEKLRLFSLEKRKFDEESDRVDRKKLFPLIRGSRMRGQRFKVKAT